MWSNTLRFGLTALAFFTASPVAHASGRPQPAGVAKAPANRPAPPRRRARAEYEEYARLEARTPTGRPPTTRWRDAKHPLPQWVRDIEDKPDQWVYAYRGFQLRPGKPVHLDRLFDDSIETDGDFRGVDFIGTKAVATAYASSETRAADHFGMVVRYRIPKALVSHGMNFDNLSPENMREKGITSLRPFVEAYTSFAPGAGAPKTVRWTAYGRDNQYPTAIWPKKDR
jgi:hypothetical protein